MTPLYKKIIFSLLVLTTAYCAADSKEKFNPSGSHNLSEQAKKAKRKRNQPVLIKNIWTPQLMPLHQIPLSKGIFFQANIGAGFLYFSGVRANLAPIPLQFFDGIINGTDIARDAPLQGGYSHNTTPLYEYILGYRCNSWLRAGISYQHQGDISFATEAVNSFTTPFPGVTGTQAYLTSDIALDGILAKVYFDAPFQFVIKNTCISSYLGLGVGIGWQTWKNISAKYAITGLATSGVPTDILLRQKISANAIWMCDLGVKIRGLEKSQFSISAGCKYNQWGQARNIGKMSQQGSQKFALSHPLIIKTVYQFAPYLGMEWAFPKPAFKKPYKITNKAPHRFKPFFAKSMLFQNKTSLWTELNAGVGFLYFSGLKGNLAGTPSTFFNPPSALSPVSFSQDAPIKGKLSYNRTPVFEYVVGTSLTYNWKIGMSYLHQGDVSIQSQSLSTFVSKPGQQLSRVVFNSNLDLDALMLKVAFEFPWSLVTSNISFVPYLALGAGPGWQTWRNVQALYALSATSIGNPYISMPMLLHQKISANAVWMADLGIRINGVYPKPVFSVLLGCKCVQWGQARNIGKLSQQDSKKFAFAKPFRIKTLYQFAPYAGVSWQFPVNHIGKWPYKVGDKNANTYKPFFVNTRLLQKRQSIWTQFNVGVGFLYFAGVNANLMGVPALDFSTLAQNIPLRGRLTYNRTPLYEYIIGSRFFNWFNVGLSYQTQSNITIQTKDLQVTNTVSSTPVNSARFTSQVRLDGLMAKFYFELPCSMVVKSIAISPYFATGVGAGWQTWKNNTAVQEFVTSGLFQSLERNYRQKISANLIWMCELGWRIRPAFQNPNFGILLGCKYNQWGQARNIGKLSQQGSLKYGLQQPFHIKMVYQFAPFIGVQWNF